WLSVAAVVALTGGCSTMKSWTGMGSAKLSGKEESPPVNTSASGTSTIAVKDDRTVSGNVTVSGMMPTAAHIHDGAPGKSGPVIVPLTKSGDNTFTVPPGTKLSDDLYKEYKAGNLYVNVHSAMHPNGEVRAQLKP
ncbi:MAG: CHRD domain-containing protein, partial [Sulfurifustis sp.]